MWAPCLVYKTWAVVADHPLCCGLTSFFPSGWGIWVQESWQAHLRQPGLWLYGSTVGKQAHEERERVSKNGCHPITAVKSY